MYKISGLVLFFALFGILSAQAQSEVTSTIENVTVFLNGAQVEREATLNLKKGENIIRLKGLTQSLNANSIQVEGNSSYTILSVKSQYDYSNQGTKNPLIKSKQDSLETLKFTLGMRNSLERVYQEEKSLLQSNRNIKGNNAVLLVDDVEEMADFYRKRLLEIEYKFLEINQEKNEINNDINRINNEIYQLGAKANLTPSEIYVTLESSKTGTATMNFSYQVYNAGWYPSYDLRTEDTDKDIELRYKAKVYQNTGNDWKDVALKLSTGNPSVGGQAPELNPWYLYLYNIEKAYSKTRYRPASSEPSYAEEDMEMSYDSVRKDEIAIGDANGTFAVTTVNTNLTNTEFDISIPYDIPSDNQEYDVEIQRLSMPAAYEYLCIPKLNKDAFLIANATEWRDLSLLPGESQVYFKGTFVGKSYIDPASTSDTLQLSLGRDPGIVVSRESIKEYCKTQSLGLKKKTSKGYKIEIKNNKSIAIDLRLEDQIPLTNTSDIEVNVQEISNAEYDEESGKLIWNLKLNPGEKKEITIKYEAKYPKNKNISNL